MRLEKAKFYLSYLWRGLIPGINWRKRREILFESQLSLSKPLIQRVNYYFKGFSKFSTSSNSKTLFTLSAFSEPSAPCIDLMNYLRYFDPNFRFEYTFQDLFSIPKVPTFTKNRPISNSNYMYVLMKLNSVRFFNFTKDNQPFTAKKNLAIFRGPCHRPHRKHFIVNCFHKNNVDAGDTRPTEFSREFHKPYMKRKDMMSNKFIISLEGNDVSSSLPWIMASNSLAFLPQPVFEGWFMQGILVPNHHYVLLKDDYSDLEEKIDYYSSNTDEALEIINNAQNHVAQFFDKKRELIISLLVLEKYFRLSGQIE